MTGEIRHHGVSPAHVGSAQAPRVQAPATLKEGIALAKEGMGEAQVALETLNSTSDSAYKVIHKTAFGLNDIGKNIKNFGVFLTVTGAGGVGASLGSFIEAIPSKNIQAAIPMIASSVAVISGIALINAGSQIDKMGMALSDYGRDTVPAKDRAFEIGKQAGEKIAKGIEGVEGNKPKSSRT